MNPVCRVYDWESDGRALKFYIPADKGICPKGHLCRRSEKLQWKSYFLCSKCETMNGLKGHYWDENQISIISQYKIPDFGWYEIEL